QLIAKEPNKEKLLRRRGFALAKLRQWQKALADFSTVIELDPKDAVAWVNRSIAYFRLGAWDKALADSGKALQLQPEDPLVQNTLAFWLATCPDPRFQDAGRAVPLAKKAVELAPHEGDYWNTLGVAHYRAGDGKAAVEALKKSTELREGGDGFGWFILAMAH